MRKLFALMLFALLLCSCSVMASAEEAKYKTAGALYSAWSNDLPDYICGVWSTDGGTTNLTFAVQNNEAGEAGKQEILKLIEDDSTVSFAYRQFSRNYLLQIFEEMHVYFDRNIGLVSLGLNDTGNCIQLEILEDRKEDTNTQQAVAEIIGKYGEAVRVGYIDERYVPASDVAEARPVWKIAFTQFTLLFPWVLVAALLFGILFVISKRRKMLLLQTNYGTTNPETMPPSSEAVVYMVKKSNYDIPSDLEQRVMAEIDTIQK